MVRSAACFGIDPGELIGISPIGADTVEDEPGGAGAAGQHGAERDRLPPTPVMQSRIRRSPFSLAR